MSETNDVNDAIKHFPRLRARTLRFGCGAPRSAQTVGDGSRALFLRSDGPEDSGDRTVAELVRRVRRTP